MENVRDSPFFRLKLVGLRPPPAVKAKLVPVGSGLGAVTGALSPGKAADIVLVDTNSLNLMPMNNPYGAIVESAHAGNVDSVWVNGRPRKRKGRLLDVDLPRLRERVNAARDGLFQRADVLSDGSWLPRPFSECADIECR